MFISSFRLRDYKSYLDSDELRLSPGINLVVGQNDAGKSALLEALGLQFHNNPHRDSSRKLNANQQRDKESTAEVCFTIEKDELHDILRSIPGQFYVPLPEPHELIELYAPERPDGIDEIESARIHIRKLLDRPRFTFRAHCNSNTVDKN